MVAKQDGIALLQAVPLFSDLSKRDLGKIWDRMRTVQHRVGHEIVTEGRHGQGFHLILDGEVKVERKNKRIKLGPVDFFGEMLAWGAKSINSTGIGPAELGTQKSLTPSPPSISRSFVPPLIRGRGTWYGQLGSLQYGV